MTPGNPGPQAPVQDQTAQPTSLPATSPELHPQVVFTDLAIVPDDEPGKWQILGLARNDSRYALEAVVATVEALDPSGSPIAAATVPLALSILQPGATSPFLARFEVTGAPEGARATLQAFRFSSEGPVRVSIEAIRSNRSSDGTLVMGSLRNRQPGAFQSRDVIVVWRDAGRSLAGMAVASVPQARVLEDGTLPWMAEAPGASPDSRFEVFAAVTAIDETLDAPLESVLGPTWRVTAQGRGFVVGAIRNRGTEPALPEVAIAVKAAGRLIGLEILLSTVPLQPGETLAYGADRFLGLEAAPEAAGNDVTLELYLTGRLPGPDVPTAIPLPASIEQFEAIGSHVFLQGTVTNPSPAPLRSAMLLLSLRSTTGETQSARWLALAPPPPGESVEFSVDVPIAAGDDPAMSEYDLRAIGIPLPESSW